MGARTGAVNQGARRAVARGAKPPDQTGTLDPAGRRRKGAGKAAPGPGYFAPAAWALGVAAVTSRMT